MSKNNSRERYKELLELSITANEIFTSENAPHIITFMLTRSGVTIGVHENLLRQGEESQYFYDYSWNIPDGSIYDPRLDAAEARIRDLVQEVINKIGETA